MEITDNAEVGSILRNQFRALASISLEMRLASDRQRRVLLIAEDDWSEWSSFVHGGPLPAYPAPPVMLRRMAAVSYRLACLAERQAAVSR
jgi:hypothetical protein